MRYPKKSKNLIAYFEDESVRVRFGIEIFNVRSIKKIKQQELASLAYTTQKVISRIESGEVNAGISLIYRLAKKLDFNSNNWSRVFKFKDIEPTIVYSYSLKDIDKNNHFNINYSSHRIQNGILNVNS